MDLHFFFKREQGASAFLATLLEQRPDVRSDFFGMLAECIGHALADSFKSKSWEVRIEEEQVDIRLDSKNNGAWVILVENKIQAGSKQPGQLLRYYSKQIQKEAATRVVAVYLAPGSMGESEVKAVKSSGLRDGDFAVRVSWETVDERLRSLPNADGFIASGLGEITKAISKARQDQYPNVGGREKIHELACRVRDGLRSFSAISMSAPWPDQARFILGSHGTNLTLWFILAFDAEPNPPYKPIHLFKGDNLCLTVRLMLKLSARGGRVPGLKSRWDKLCQRDGTLDVPEVGIHKLQGRWLVHERKLSATPDCMVSELTNIGASLLRVVEDWETAP